MATQNHGFVFEDYIIKNCFGIYDKIPHTSKYDIPKEYNEKTRKNISIKFAKKTPKLLIHCGDCLRNYDYSDDDIMYVGIYTKQRRYRNLEYLFEIKLKVIKIILDKYLDKNDVEYYKNMIKTIPYGKASRECIDTYKNYKKKFTNPYINIHPKVDSKRQRRVQLSINLINIINDYPKYVTHLEDFKINGVQVIKYLL